jgi:hypothetical protein
MPELVPITNNFFVNLINRLGLKPPPGLGWLFSTVVQPVSLVDSDVTLSAISTTQILDTPFTQGEVASPVGAGALLADTGAQQPGNYSIFVMVSGDNAVAWGADVRLQRRDAANAANIWSQEMTLNNAGTSLITLSMTVTLSLNERIRVITKAAATVGVSLQANIWLRAA